jgi:DMSO/TMAO reductase YedYZ molybdopterin-dependent catalytic subunit
MAMSVSRPTRRGLLAAAAAGTGLLAVPGLAARAVAGAPYILKPLPSAWFIDYGTNAEMRWDSVSPQHYLTSPERLFVRDHTATPTIDASTYALRVFGDGLATARSSDQAVTLSYADLRSMPTTRLTTVHECTGNGRSFFASQQGTPAAGTQWKLGAVGAVGAVAWEGVRLATVLERVGLDPRAVSIMATGLDANYVTGGVDYGPVRRPFPIDKALHDALLVWGADGRDLLPDHGYPIRLLLPGWVGIGSIKWLGSLEVSSTEQTSPWNTIWYRMTGGSYPPDSPPLTVNPVRSAFELAWGATLARQQVVSLTGRSWSGAGPIDHVDISTDGGSTWDRARIRRGGRRDAWTQWEYPWRSPEPGDHEVMARATDVVGRRQPLVTPYNNNGYFFDAVVRHPVTVA